MKWFWWQFGSSELYEILCVSFALVWDCELCEILCVSFACVLIVLSFTSSWGIGFWFELSICTWSVLSPFCLFLRDHVLCLSCVELLPLSLGAEIFHFERSCVCLFTWLLDLLDELLFIPLVLIFFTWRICVGCCQCTHQGGDWGPMVVTLGWWVIDNIVWSWCVSWLVMCRCRMWHDGRRREVKVRRKIHAEGPWWGMGASRPGPRDPMRPGGVMGGPHGARKSKSTWWWRRRRPSRRGRWRVK